MENWQTSLVNAAKSAKSAFESVELVGNEAHALVIVALLEAFHSEPDVTIFAEPRIPDRRPAENARPTDALILSPLLGSFLVEVKGWVIEQITRIEAGTIFRRAGGYEEAHNPWNQAQDASSQIQKATRRVLQRRRFANKDMPHFDWVVALPNISRAEWLQKGYENSIADCELLLKEDLDDPAALKARLEKYIRSKAGRRLPFSVEQLRNVREALGNSDVIRSRRLKSSSTAEKKLGDAINRVELKDKRLSSEQIQLIEAEFDGRPQLVRGVAGSGKSIVLVKNFVNFLDRQINQPQLAFENPHPTKRYAIVCYNRTLVPFLRRNFEDSFRALTYKEPPQYVDIYSFNKLMYQLSSHNGGPLEYQRYGSARDEADIALRHATRYSEQLDHLAHSNKMAFEQLLYDAIYVDEGQDLFDEEYLVLMRLLRVDRETGLKNIVIFYDDAQNVYGRPRPTWSKLGIQITGRTNVMKTCFRNRKPIIDFAFNLLLGVKSETRVLTKSFADVAYLRENGLIEELPDRWKVNFADRIDGEIPTVDLFQTRATEKQWLIHTISNLVQTENVNPDDILVLFDNDKEYAGFDFELRRVCPKIKSVVKPYGRSDNPAKDEYIFLEDAITITTVESAKGYDCPIAFVVGADLFSDDVTGRALFYVAATRCKFKLFVTGLQKPGTLAEEAKAVADLLKTPASASVGKAPMHTERLQSSSLATQELPETNKEAPAIKNFVTRLLKKGDRVSHPIYGAGIVLKDGRAGVLVSQNAQYQFVDVQFDTVLKVHIAAELAGLALIEDSCR